MSDLGCQLIAEVRRIAAGDPLFEYYNDSDENDKGCTYIRHGEPDCLIGRALWNIGLINASWQGDQWEASDIEAVVTKEDWPLDVSEVDWLAEVQRSQDNASRWGHCIRLADDRT